MRVPTDLPRPRANRSRVWLGAAAAIAVFGMASLRGVASFFTEYLWFGEVGLTGIFTGVLRAKFLLFMIFTLGFFLACWVNLVIAERLAPRDALPPDEFVARYRETAGQYSGRLRVLVSALLALFTGGGVSSQWNKWVLFQNATDFGVDDPQFGRDVGFYMFKLPFLSFVANWVWVALFVIAIVTAGMHYLGGGIRLQAARDRVTPQVKAHISVLLALAALAKAAGYWLQRFELNFSTRGAVEGATYTDVNAQLPALQLLILISLVATVLFVVNIRRQGWVLPVIAVGLWAFIQIIVGAVYPAFIQKFRVEPQENRREAPYIARNIEATRTALGIDGVEEVAFPYEEELSAADLESHAATIRNIRLWDPGYARQTYQKLQGIRSYYTLSDVDIDRYEIDGQQTQTLVSVREIDPEGLPSESWINRHLQYTHGYGAVLAPANAVQSGRPDFLLRDVPPIATSGIELEQPRIYYGESSGGYAIVNTGQKELDFQRPNGTTEESTYTGKGGVVLSSFTRRAAFALKFGNLNPVLSNLITDRSKVIFVRDISDRVRKAAPFLRYDSDPYPVLLDGRIVWVQDAYTVSTMYPYAQRADTDRIPNGSGLRTEFNYVRNSVKVVIDAYDGTMTFYVTDDKDPIVKTYAKAFPELFTPGSRMDPELRRHLRYPEDLFRLQTNMYGRYHITDPGEFYNAGDAWNVSQDPGSGSPTQATQTNNVTNAQGLVVASKERRMDPTYLLMRLPGEEKETFLILQPFVPSSREDKQKNLTSFMVARSDPGNYGKLTTYVMPRGQQIDGPALADQHISADPDVSREISLLDQRGSRVLLGNVVVVPIENSLMYVRPLYVSSDRSELPELKRVIVVFAEKVAMRPTLSEALQAIFGDAPPTLEGGGETPPGDGGTGPPAARNVGELLSRADALFAEADAALRAGDLATYQAKIKEAVALVRQARERSDPSAGPTTSTTEPASA